MTLSQRTFVIGIAFVAGLLLLPPCSAKAGRGYESRGCGFDMNRNGVIGECRDHAGGLAACPDCHVCDGVTTDVDGDGVNEDLTYVDCSGGSDTPSCGAPGSPCHTINYALNTRADGPGDGAEDIICFKGTCANEPDSMKFGPDGVSTSASNCGGTNYYTRPKSGNEVRDYQYPCNPAMIVGWDADNDGNYPPHDSDDVAVIDGTGKHQLFSGDGHGPPSYYEMAHFTAKEYGRSCAADGAGNCGFFKAGNAGTRFSQDVYIHDIQLVDLDREVVMPGGSSMLIFNFFDGKFRHFALENVECQDCGGIFLRGEPVNQSLGVTVGPMRFKNLTWRARGSGPVCSGCGGAIAVKLWGLVNGLEFIDNKFDMNLDAWTPGDFHYTSAMVIGQCAQDIDIINNEFIDPLTAGINLQAASTTHGIGACDSRPVDDVNIRRNVFRATHLSPAAFCCSTFIQLNAVGSGSLSTEYINNVTIADNFFSTTTSGDRGYEAAIYSTAARNGSPIPGAVTIVNNTIQGSYQGRYYPRASIGIRNEFGLAYPQQNYIIKNNIVSGTASASVIRAYYAPSSFVSDFNVFDPRATFVWNDGTATALAGWRSNTGGDDTSSTGNGATTPRPACAPSFVNEASGDLHLASSDTCARAHGVDLSSISALDIDGNVRPQGSAWDVGADQGGLAPPTLWDVTPVSP